MASRYFVAGGVDNLWSTIGNWSLTDNGAGGQAVPLATDDVFFTSNSPNCTINTSARVAKSLTTTGYTNTLTFDQQLSVSGSITLGSGMNFAGATTNKLRMIAAGTWTTNGKTIPQNVEIGGTTTFTCTLASAVTISGALTLTNTTSTIFAGSFLLTAASCTISGSQTITLVNDVQINGLTTISDANVINGAYNWKTFGLTTTGALTGTSTVVFNGTGTWTGAAGACSNIVTINCPGDTLTLSGTILFAASGTPTLTYTAGTVDAGTSVLSIASSCTFDLGAVSLYDLTLTAALTLTINSLLLVSRNLTMPNAAVTFAGSFGWTIYQFGATAATATRIYTFAAGKTYTVTGRLVISHAAAQTVRYTLTASAAAYLVLGPSGDQDVAFCDPTNINSEGGQPIFSYSGVATTSPNWYVDIGIVASSFLSPPRARAQLHLGM